MKFFSLCLMIMTNIECFVHGLVALIIKSEKCVSVEGVHYDISGRA